MATEVVVRKWGSSLGVILPRNLVEKERLKENEKILVQVVKEGHMSKVFCTLKRKMSGQAFKDMVREGWKQ